MSGAQASGRLDQRRLNELAASLQKAHRALIEETRLRREGEHLEVYMARIAAPLPNENQDRYRARVERYLAAIRQAEQATHTYRAVPVLSDRSPGNVTLWKNACRLIADLPVRVTKTQAEWRTVQAEERRAHPPAEKDRAIQAFGLELTETLRLVKDASDALRDARP